MILFYLIFSDVILLPFLCSLFYVRLYTHFVLCYFIIAFIFLIIACDYRKLLQMIIIYVWSDCLTPLYAWNWARPRLHSAHFGMSTLLCTEVGSDLNCLCAGGVRVSLLPLFSCMELGATSNSHYMAGIYFELGTYSNRIYIFGEC